jgi:CheY-like chemotaxis protein
VAYAIVQEHGGRIALKSEPGRGASFHVEFPVGAGPLKPPLPKPPDHALSDNDIGAGSAVLVVEDEAALGAAVAEALGDAGFSVDRASDGLEALERLRERDYNLIVCDLKMPRLDGTAFYRELETLNPVLAGRVLFVTGDVAGTDAERFLEETGCRWLAKPFRLKDLLRVAREMLV